MTTTGALPANPFPGMNPYLETPALWHGVHNRTIVGLGNLLARRLRPEYSVAIEERVHISAEPGGNGSGGDNAVIRIPDAVVLAAAAAAPSSAGAPSASSPRRFPAPERSKDAIAVHLPPTDLFRQRYLEVRRANNRQVVAVIELLSPTNKDGYGRQEYLAKRAAVLSSPAHLVEIDLLRAGQRMPVIGDDVPDTDYRILVANARRTEPVADLYPFGIRQPIPDFVLPLAQDAEGIAVNLNGVVNQVYADGSYDLDIDYRQAPPEPPLSDDDRRWLDGLLRAQGLR